MRDMVDGRKRLSRWATAATVVWLAAVPPAAAVEIPSAVEPSRIAPGVTGPPEPRLSAPGEALPTFPEEVPLPPPPSGEQVRFILRQVSIEGTTVYAREQLAPLYANELGKIVPVAEAQAIANRITTRYRADGYVLSQAVVPRQNLHDGILHIRVVEGFVDRVEVEGDGKDADPRGLVESYGEKIMQDRPLHIATLERYLLLMNDLPGMAARGWLQPSPKEVGAATLLVTLTHKDVQATLSTDNRVTRYLGRVQENAMLAANSLAGVDERTQLQAGMADPARNMHTLGVQHEEQLDSEGTRLILAASDTRTRPGLTLTPLDLDADSTDLQLTVQHPFVRLRAETLNGHLAFDYRNTETTVFDGTLLTSDRVRALRLGGDYTFADRMQGTSVVDLLASRGLPVFNPSTSGDLRTQPAAPGNYTKINLDASRIQSLPFDLSLFTAVSGQAAADPLLASEQFALGGPAFGSAYDPGTLAGDEGAAARAELRYGGEFNSQLPVSYQAYGFYDIGSVWDKTKTPDKSSLASSGIGVRFSLGSLTGSAELAVPLTHRSGLASEDHSPRLFFSLSGSLSDLTTWGSTH